MNIKKGLEERYAKYVKINSKLSEDDNGYSKACVDCAEIMGNFIDEGKSFDEAECLMLDTPDGQELTGFMMGMIMRSLYSFHERGEEIKSWWNKKSGGTGKEKGTINPAIITIGK